MAPPTWLAIRFTPDIVARCAGACLDLPLVAKDVPKTHVYLGHMAATYTCGSGAVNQHSTTPAKQLRALRATLTRTVRTLAALQRALAARPRTMRTERRRQERARDAMRARTAMIARRKRLG